MSTEDTKAVMQKHQQAMMSGDPDKLTADYAADAVMFSNQGMLRGTDAIREHYVRLPSMIPADAMKDFKVVREDFDGDICYAIWTMGNFIPMGTETFVCRNGKIVSHTMAVYLPQQG
jgi:uncharacterized protein (TIGR02246 family)